MQRLCFTGNMPVVTHIHGRQGQLEERAREKDKADFQTEVMKN